LINRTGHGIFLGDWRLTEKKYSSCEWNLPRKKIKSQKRGDRIHRHKGNCSWSGVNTQKYKSVEGNWSAIIRRVLVGSGKETAKFHVRYFEIAPGGFSSFEKHRHEHFVIVIRGKGMVRLKNRNRELHYLDTVFIGPGTPHQLKNPYKEPFGFLCIVNAKRDKPVLLE
jgi:ribulose-bisphosphate carboxylase large chain